MGKEILKINRIVGYMMKVMRKHKKITLFKEEFSSIRHGDYDKFIKLLNVEEPIIIAYENGIIKTSCFSKESGDCDFGMILASSNALDKFYVECKGYYGNIIDDEICDDVYEQLAEFEISLRLHGNNEGINEKKTCRCY